MIPPNSGESLVAINSVLRRLGEHADELTHVEFGTLFGGIPDARPGIDLVTRALTDAEEAARLVGAANLGHAAVDDAQKTVRMLEHASYDEIALRDLGHRLGEHVTRIGSSQPLREAEAAALLDGASANTTPADWARLYARVADADLTALQSLPDQVAGRPSLRDALASLAAGGTTATYRDIDHYRAAASVAALSRDAQAAEIRALVQHHAADLAPEELTRLGALLDTPGAHDALPTMADHSAFATAARAASDDASLARTVQPFLDDIEFATLTPDELVTRADQLLQRPIADLTHDDWMRIARYVEHDGAANRIVVPRTWPGSEDFVVQAREIGEGQYAAGQYMQPYFDAYAVKRLRPAEYTAAADALLSREPSSLTNDEWSRLAMLVEQDADASLVHVPRTIDGSMDLVEQARKIAAGEFRPQRYMDVYFDRYAVGKLTPEARIATADDLLTRDPASLDAADWRRLAALVEDDAGNAIKVPREMPGAKPIVEQAREIAAGEYQPGSYMGGYFDQYAVNRLAAAERAAAADELFAKGADNLTDAEWSRLAAFVDSDTDGTLIPVTREIEGSLAFTEQARQIAAGQYRPSRYMHVYFDQYAAAKLTGDERLAAADALLMRNPDELSNEEWRRLAALIDADGDARIPVAREVDGSLPLTQQAREIAAGEYRPSRYATIYFDEYAVARMGADERLAAADTLLTRNPDELSDEEWRRLAALVSTDTANRIPVAREIDGSLPFAQQAREIAAGEYRPSRYMRVYFDQYAVGRLTPEARAAEASSLLSRTPESLTDDEWRRLAAIVDADADMSIVNVPRELDGSLPLAQQAREIADGKYRPGQHMQVYFTRWQRDNDPQYLARLEAALDDVVANTASPEARRLVADQWDRLEAIVAGRPPSEQAAIAQVMLDSDSVSGSRSVKSTLELLQASLSETPAPTRVAQLQADTLELIQRNLSRLSGVTPDGAVAGYSNHPDYAEIGRIRANTHLIEFAKAHEARAAAAPQSQAKSVTDVVERKPTPGANGEQLTW